MEKINCFWILNNFYFENLHKHLNIQNYNFLCHIVWVGIVHLPTESSRVVSLFFLIYGCKTWCLKVREKQRLTISCEEMLN